MIFPLHSDPDQPSFAGGVASVADLLRGSRNIIVLAGAGISTSSGVPDFRSPGTGLYETLDLEALDLTCAEDLFNLEFFCSDPRPFYRFARQLYPVAGGEPSPTPAHRFLSLLEQRKQLLRVYTQNIDGLEEKAGVPPTKIVQTHGCLNWAACLKCHRRVDASEIAADVQAGRVPTCQRDKSGGKKKKRDSEKSKSHAVKDLIPPKKRPRRQSSKRKESGWTYGDGMVSWSANDENGLVATNPNICGGVLKPGVTFFGEKLPDQVSKRLEKDKAKADALIVMGTSLSVAPMSKVIQYLDPSIPRILINRNLVKAPPRISDVSDASIDINGRTKKDQRDGYVFDVCLLGSCDVVSMALRRELGYDPTVDQHMALGQKNCGRVLANADKDNDYLIGNQEELHGHPPDRIFLFEGAVLESGRSKGSCISNAETACKEVAHCDGCGEQIDGQIMKCMQCFDFDLCSCCYPDQVKSHFKGRHEFVCD
jgi:NAD-dependent SIR2 family protein deacetylase